MYVCVYIDIFIPTCSCIHLLAYVCIYPRFYIRVWVNNVLVFVFLYVFRDNLLVFL